MTKEDVAELLKNAGYESFVDEFGVMVYADRFMSKKEFKKLDKEVHKTGYRATWGYVVRKK